MWGQIICRLLCAKYYQGDQNKDIETGVEISTEKIKNGLKILRDNENNMPKDRWQEI
jgi:hypothetical protein